MYRDTGEGKEPVAPALMAMALLLQAYVNVSDAEGEPASRSSTSNLELALVRADGITRARAVDPEHLELSALECVARALVGASWPTRAHADLRVYLRWSAVETVLDHLSRRSE